MAKEFMTLLGALHLHSTYSDGEFTLAELRDILRHAGCRFACMTDHAEAFDEAKLQEYVSECNRLSNAEFLFIPGLETNCQEKMHILGFGVPKLLGTTNPQEVIAAIRGHDGIAVIAHPKASHFPWIEMFDTLPDGIETWNTKYDGRYAPRPQTFALLKRLQSRRPEMHAFYGIDLHWRKQYRGLFTRVASTELNRESILADLAQGRYVGQTGELRLPASGDVPQRMMCRFARLHGYSDSLRGVAKSLKSLLDRVGTPLPGPIKRQLRRFF